MTEVIAAIVAAVVAAGITFAIIQTIARLRRKDAQSEAQRILASRDWESAPLDLVARELILGLVRRHRANTGTLRALARRRMDGRTPEV